MDWQLYIVGILIALSIAYLVRATWRTWFRGTSSGCSTGCGKCASSPAPTHAGGPRRISLPQV